MWPSARAASSLQSSAGAASGAARGLGAAPPLSQAESLNALGGAPVSASPAAPAVPADLASVYSRVRSTDPHRRALVEEMLRVDHAGEVGAVQIYAGQLWMLRRGSADYRLIESMKKGEEAHLATLQALMADRRARPTALLPLAQVAGWLLGAASALLGPAGAMACTVAVETVIGGHYNDQIRTLLAAGHGAEEAQLLAVFRKHRDDELEHLDTGLASGAEAAPAYAAVTTAIKAGCVAAIEVVKRV